MKHIRADQNDMSGQSGRVLVCKPLCALEHSSFVWKIRNKRAPCQLSQSKFKGRGKFLKERSCYLLLVKFLFLGGSKATAAAAPPALAAVAAAAGAEAAGSDYISQLAPNTPLLFSSLSVYSAGWPRAMSAPAFTWRGRGRPRLRSSPRPTHSGGGLLGPSSAREYP